MVSSVGVVQPAERNKIPPAPPHRDKIGMNNNEHRKNQRNIHLNTIETMNPWNILNTLIENDETPKTIAPLTTSNQRTSTTNIKNNIETHRTLNQINIDKTKKQTLKPLIRNLLNIECIVNESTIGTCLIDSGAACNCVSRTFINNNNIEIHPAEPLLITLANKSTTTTNETCILHLQSPKSKHKFTITAIVLPELSSSNIILGMPFLEQFNPIIDWKNKTIDINNNKTNINDNHQSSTLLLSSFSIGSSSSNISSSDTSILQSKETISKYRSQPPSNSAQSLLQQVPSPIPINNVPLTTNKIKLISYSKFKRLQNDPTNQICLIQVTNIEPTKIQMNNIELNNENTKENDKSTDIKPIYNEHEQRIHIEYKDIFDPLPIGLPPKRSHDHHIELLPDSQPVSKPAYRLASNELDELRSQLDKLLEHGHIRPSHSPFGSPVLFVKKKDGSMRMCVDYRMLNNITIKNSYPLPRVDELLDRLSGAKWFSKIDLQQGYHQLRIHPPDIPKTAFVTRYGSYEFMVLPFGLCNGPSTFMNMMQDILRPYLDKYCISYLDDILIYSNSLEEHKKHVNTILNTLRENKLQAKLSKCEFMKEKIEFLGFEISGNGIGMMNNKVKAILDWPTPRCVKDIRSFLGLAGYYRKFIHMFSNIVSSLNDLLKKETKFYWTSEHQNSFETLKLKISQKPTLILPHLNLPFIVQTDSSGFAIGASLNQDIGNGLQPIAFLSKKLLPAETRYPTHEMELLAIIISLKEWRHYLYGKKFIVQTDHKSIIHFKTQQYLSSRQIRWSEFLQQFDFTIEYKAGNENVVADALSRRYDHENIDENNLKLKQRTINDTFEKNKIENNNNLTTLNELKIDSELSLNEQIIQSYEIDNECKKILNELESINEQKYNEQNENKEEMKEENISIQYNRHNEYRLNENGLILKNDKILIPNNELIRTMILTSCHDDKTAGHVGITKTIDLVTRTFVWKNMTKHIKEYVNTCIQCQLNKPTNQQPLGLLNPIQIPEQRWHTVTLDLITSLPRSKQGNDAIVVFVDKFSKLSHYVPTTTDITAPRLATLFIDNIVRLHGLPSNIISDRDPRFTSLFWKSMWKQLGTNLSMSTSFHPQSDGQTERQNRTLEESLRSYIDYNHSDWDIHLSILELAHNNSIHASTGYSPMFLNYGQHPRMPIHHLLGNDLQINDTALTMIEKLYDNLEFAKENIKKAQLNQAKYSNEHRRENETWKIGEKVLLSTTNLRRPGRAPKLCSSWIGPFEIKRVLSNVTYELKLPNNMRIHPVFHISHLKKSKESLSFPSRTLIDHRPPPELLDETKEEVFIVEKILKKKISRNKIYYLVKWFGYPEWELTWEPETSFKEHRDAINTFEKEQRQDKVNSNSNSFTSSNSYLQSQSQRQIQSTMKTRYRK